MPQYHFQATRSTKPDDQVDGIHCQHASIGGEFYATDAKEFWHQVRRFLIVPGTWIVTARNGSRWLKARKFIAEIVKK